MQQTDVIFHLQQQNAATNMSDLYVNLSTIPEQLLAQAKNLQSQFLKLRGN